MELSFHLALHDTGIAATNIQSIAQHRPADTSTWNFACHLALHETSSYQAIACENLSFTLHVTNLFDTGPDYLSFRQTFACCKLSHKQQDTLLHDTFQPTQLCCMAQHSF